MAQRAKEILIQTLGGASAGISDFVGALGMETRGRTTLVPMATSIGDVVFRLWTNPAGWNEPDDEPHILFVMFDAADPVSYKEALVMASDRSQQRVYIGTNACEDKAAVARRVPDIGCPPPLVLVDTGYNMTEPFTAALRLFAQDTSATITDPAANT